jgi:hypothetical protein
MKIALAPSTQAAEYRRNLAVAEACKPVLEAAGVECRIFSSPPLPNDSTAGQSKSNAEMQAWGPDLTFALHNDWIGDAKPRGILVLIDDDHPELADEAESIGRKAAARQGIAFEEVRQDSRRFVFWEYSGKTGPPTPNCILWENGNMASPADMQRLEGTLDLQGRSLAEAILEHYGMEEERMTPEQEAKLDAAIKSGQAASYRENVMLAHLSGDTAKAQQIAEEGREAGFRIEYHPQ